MYGIDNATCIFESTALAGAKLAAGPASVDQPAVNFVLGHALGEHLSVASRLRVNFSTLIDRFK
jgi:hypothetical protein